MVSNAVLFAPADRHDGTLSAPRPLRPPADGLALMPIGNRPLLLHALDELVAAGIDQVAVVSEPGVAPEVERHLGEWSTGACQTAHLSVDEACGFIDAVKQAAALLGPQQFVVHLGDSLRHEGLADSIAEAPDGDYDVVALAESPGADVYPVGAGLSSLQTAGIYVFGPGILELALEHPVSPRWDLQIAAATERLTAAGGRVEVRFVHDWWRYRQRPDILLQANRFFLSGLKRRPTGAQLENTDLQGPVAIDSSARLRSTTVRGPALIGPDVELTDAYIGPYSCIGRGVTIENAEVEHSIILPGASIRHLGGRLEASVIGPGARIFRDFRLPRALRLNVGEGAEIALT
jgi:glucose-1-phosphate thymidylyltransferase